MITYDNPIPLYLVNGGLLLYDHVLAFETALLLPEAAFQDGIRSEDLTSQAEKTSGGTARREL